MAHLATRFSLIGLSNLTNLTNLTNLRPQTFTLSQMPFCHSALSYGKRIPIPTGETVRRGIQGKGYCTTVNVFNIKTLPRSVCFLPNENINREKVTKFTNFSRKSSIGFSTVATAAGQDNEISELGKTHINYVLEFWFGPWATLGFTAPIPDDAVLAKARTWFEGSPELDRTIRDRFLVLIEKARNGQLTEWEASPHGALSLVILLDQFSRNAYRDKGEAFEGDKLALEIAKRAVEKGFDKKVFGPMRLFFYFPFEHDEELSNQELSVQYFKKALMESTPELKKFSELTLDFAERHLVVIQKFGRFPHRNVPLGRESTKDEIEYLKGGKWF